MSNLNELQEIPEIEEPTLASLPSVKLLGDLLPPIEKDPLELIQHRFLCRGAGMLLVGPTGIGKSSLSMQMMLSWAIGRPCFELRPTRPIKSLLIQAENDEGDLCEMRDGVLAGLDFTREERGKALFSVEVATIDNLSGLALISAAERLLEQHQPDILWLDPLFSFLGTDVSKQEGVSRFLRNWLNPLLRRFNCAGILTHHCNKPASGREKSDWQAGDFAYLGAGSAELANWARAVIAIRSIGQHGVFELCLGKRGGRAGWNDLDGAKAYSKHIAHSKVPGAICWRLADEEEVPTNGRPRRYDAGEVLGLLPEDGLSAGDWMKKAEEECGVKSASFHRIRKELADTKRVFKSKVSGKWQPILTP